MYFSASAAAESDYTLPGSFGAKVAGRIVELHGEPGKTVTKVVAKARITDYEDHLPRIDASTRPTTISFPRPPETTDLIELLQFIESVGSFWFGIRKIHWNAAEYRWEPESAEEKAKVEVFSFSSKRDYPKRTEVLLPQALPELLEDRARLGSLVLPLAFYREGLNDYTSHRYINAYFNYYFFIEDLFGEGHSKNVKVLHAFKRSAELRWAVEKTANDIQTQNMPDHIAALEAFLKREGLSWNTDGLLALLVQTRGTLHHFSQKSTKLKGHPLNQETFRSMAFLAFAICLNVITRRIPRPRNSVAGTA
jgi:hypothetical protein